MSGQTGPADALNNQVDEYGNPIIDHDLEHDGEIISEEVLNETDMLGDIEIEYVEEGEEVILDANGEGVMHEMATESLVALSQGTKEHEKVMRTQYHMPRETMRSPRILRRPIVQARHATYDQGSSRQSAKPNFPLPPNTKRLLPVATLQMNRPRVETDWREAQKRQLELSEIMEILPNHMKGTFERILNAASKGTIFPTKGGSRFNRDYGDVPHETAARIYKESEELDQQHNEMERKKPMEPVDYNDMPHLEEAADQNENAGNEAQIDVEHYDSTEEGHDQMGYLIDENEVLEEDIDYRDDDSMKVGHRRGDVIIRDEYYGGSDMTNYPGGQLMMNQPYQDGTRYCPGCKLSLKRSIFYHHSRMIKKYGICNMFTPKRFPCGHPGCDEKMGTVEKLCEHMHQIHNAPTNIKSANFANAEEFEVFLRELEAKGGNFRMSRGNKMIKSGVVQYFRCNRTQAMAKDKTMRICDEVGIFGEPVGSGVIDQQDDPFLNPTIGGKPQLRTEEACTAFFRKAFLPDGSIEVRYCDHHLHEDERLRLPQPVKERIYDMHRKQLQPAVILMVLQEEKDKFAVPGSAVERKLMNLTAKDISAVISTRNSNARKRNKARMEGRNIAADCDELTIEPNAPLSETEEKCLKQYIANEQHILRDMAEMKRKENKRRHLRESIRNNIFHLGRFIRTSTFSEMEIEHMEHICEYIKNAAAITRMKSINGNVSSEGHQSSSVKIESPSMRSQHGREMMQNMVQDTSYQEGSVVTEGHVDVDEDFLTITDEPSTSTGQQQSMLDTSGQLEEQEQIIVEAQEPPKKKRGRRPKEMIVKEEETVHEPEFANEPVNLGARTRTGRTVRPSRYFLD